MDALVTAMTQAVSAHNPTTETTTPPPESTGGEAIVPGAETPEEKKEAISPRLSALIKREGTLLRREQELKKREQELKTSGEGKMTREDFMKSMMDEYEEDPYEFMNKNGFSYEKLQNRILGGDEGLKMTKFERKIAELESKLTEKDKAKASEQEEDEEKQYSAKKTQAIAHIEQEVLKSEEFELIQNEGAFDEVYNVIQEYYRETNKILSVHEAATLVEKHLEDDFKKRLEYKKVKKWTSPAEQAFEETNKSHSSEQSSPKPTETKTITSDMISSSSSSKSDLELTDEERMAKAIRIMKGEKV